MNPAFFRKLATALGQTLDAALSRRDRCTHAILLTLDVEVGIRFGHTRRRHRELRKSIKAAQRPPFDPTLGLELRRLASDTNRVRLRRKGGDDRARALARYQPSPRRFDVQAEGCHRPQPRHDNTPLRETQNSTRITAGQERTNRVYVRPVTTSSLAVGVES